MTVEILTGDAREILATLPGGSVSTCITSPPYWGLRDYGVEGQVGLEETPDAYVERIVEVFREVRRTLRDDGTLWLNLGDCYAGSTQKGGTDPSGLIGWDNSGTRNVRDTFAPPRKVPPTLKPKDLVGIPWRVAFALQADGWYLRSDIIWHKPNPMPESVTDRPTKAHEYLFLFAKSQGYFYDADAIAEPSTSDQEHQKRKTLVRSHGDSQRSTEGMQGGHNVLGSLDGKRNRRTVWTITTQPYPEAHFATFPEALVEPCIRAGTSDRGCCPNCGNPWIRQVDAKPSSEARKNHAGHAASKAGASRIGGFYDAERETIGWRPSCGHDLEPVPCVVLDPFAGSGTTLAVAKYLDRSAIGIELNPEYVELARKRLAARALPLFERGTT